MYEKAKLILDKNSVSNLYNLKFVYKNYKFKIETINCLLIKIENNTATFLNENRICTFDLHDEDITLYAKKSF